MHHNKATRMKKKRSYGMNQKRLLTTSSKQKKLSRQEILMIMEVQNEKNTRDGMEVKSWTKK